MIVNLDNISLKKKPPLAKEVNQWRRVGKSATPR
jgi:hypothetical protein